jgi:seryl-tRNA synthetase
MIDIKLIRENPKKVKEACENKQIKIDIDKILDLDKKRRKMIQEVEKLKAEKNKLGQKDKARAKQIKNKIKKSEPELKKMEKQFNELMLKIPNLPLSDVPIGESEKDNKVVKRWPKAVPPSHKATAGKQDYLEIAEKLDIIDVKRAAKVSGTRFGYLKKEAALLEFGLIQLAFDVLIKQGFTPIVPPIMLRPEMMAGTGHLTGADKNEKYFVEKDKLYLAGSAEQPIVAMHTNEIFNEKELPKRYVGFSTCFRREAGSYGKDTKGIFRVHQFDKVEMVSFCKPEDSVKEHKFFLSLEEKLMRLLKIPYQVVYICTGDLGFPAAACYDIEAWMPSENRYRETHSTFNDTDFQTRRLNIRYHSKKEIDYVHALNGTAFGIGRAIIAIIENYQQKDGTIKVPQVLQKYIKIKKIG